MKTCRQGHSYSGNENYRAGTGRCPVCFREVQSRYNRSDKGRVAHARYETTEKAIDRKARYVQSPKGWLSARATRRAHAMRRRANRVTD